MKSETSVAEIEMQGILKECEDIIDDSYLKTQDARRIMDKGYKILLKCAELRISRDLAITRKKEGLLEIKKLKKLREKCN